MEKDRVFTMEPKQQKNAVNMFMMQKMHSLDWIANGQNQSCISFLLQLKKQEKENFTLININPKEVRGNKYISIVQNEQKFH